MRIAKKSWQTYIDKLRMVNDAAAAAMLKYVTSHDINTNAGTAAAIDYAYGLVTKYGEAASELACQMYDAIAELEGKNLPPAEPAKTATYTETAIAVNGTLHQYTSPDVVSGAVARLVKRTGVDTTMQNAIRDGAEWAWIPTGDTCAFCITLASRGWQRASQKALKGGHATHIHANCDCTYAIRHKSSVDVAGYNGGKEYLRMYETAEGGSSQQRINSMRRDFYAENKDRINAQKRSAYARRTALNSSAAEEINVNSL